MGANVTTYPSAGDAVRGQISNITNAINKTEENVYYENEIILQSSITTGYKLNGDGSASVDASANIYKYSVNAGDVLYLHLSNDTDGTYQFQNVASPINASKMIGNAVHGAVDDFVVVPAGASYLLVSQSSDNITNYVKNTKNIKNDITRIDGILYANGGNLFDKDNPHVINGYFSSSAPEIVSDRYRKSIYIPIDPTINTNITVTKTVSSSVLRIGYTTTEPTLGTTVNDIKSSSDQYRTYLLDNSARYVVINLYGTSETNSFVDVLNGLVIEYGTTSHGYLPYRMIDPILQSDMSPFLMKNFMKTAKTPIVTLTDDGNNSVDGLDSLHTLCETLGIKCTYACLTYLIDPDATGYDANILSRFKTWQAEGYHITTESQTHGDHWATATLDVDECEKDVIKSLVILREQGFIDYEYLCTPNGQRAPSVQKMCKKWCKAMVTGGSILNKFYDDGRFNIHRIFIVSDASGGLGLAGYKALIDDCYDNGGWLVFGVHTKDTTEYDATLVGNVMQYAITKGCEVLPLNQAYKIKEPIYTWGECFN